MFCQKRNFDPTGGEEGWLEEEKSVLILWEGEEDWLEEEKSVLSYGKGKEIYQDGFCLEHNVSLHPYPPYLDTLTSLQ